MILHCVSAITVNKTTSQNRWPQLIRINELIETARSVVPKNRAERDFFLAASTAKFWKRDISTASERAFPDFFGDIFGCSTPSKRGVLVHTRIYSLALKLCQRFFRRRREETAYKRRRIKINLVMLHVLTYVVSNKLFWNSNGVVWFVSQEVWFDKGFVIWHFRNYCVVQIVSLRSLSVGVRILSTTNVLIDRLKNFK